MLADRVGLARLASAAASIDHGATGPDALAALRDGFDRAARIAPEASVAAYSLGQRALLDSATVELVDWLAARCRLDGDILDLGCGIGRIAAALAPLARSVLGIDIAPAMIEEARRRHGDVARFAVTDGRGITGVFDLIVAVDSFPYLIQAGVAEKHVADAARALHPGGVLAIFNLSYRGVAADRADARRWCVAHGFELTCDGIRPFRLWDGRAFLLKRAD